MCADFLRLLSCDCVLQVRVFALSPETCATPCGRAKTWFTKQSRKSRGVVPSQALFPLSYMLVWWATIIGEVVGIPTVIMGYTFLAAGKAPSFLCSWRVRNTLNDER